MADGPATWERLHAAPDLYHMDRIQGIYLRNEQQTARYNFVRRESDTRVQREIDFLAMLGVPSAQVRTVDPVLNDWLSSRSEAVGRHREWPSVQRLVVVTSAPHARRSLLCYKRRFAATTKITVVSATPPAESTETHLPIWLEYLKSAVYWSLV